MCDKCKHWESEIISKSKFHDNMMSYAKELYLDECSSNFDNYLALRNQSRFSQDLLDELARSKNKKVKNYETKRRN